jgi:hypothetical protein
VSPQKLTEWHLHRLLGIEPDGREFLKVQPCFERLCEELAMYPYDVRYFIKRDTIIYHQLRDSERCISRHLYRPEVARLKAQDAKLGRSIARWIVAFYHYVRDLPSNRCPKAYLGFPIVGHHIQ